MKVLAFDTETTGIPEYSIPSDDPVQPHLVELAAILYDMSEGRQIGSMHARIKHGDWQDNGATAIHGLYPEILERTGVEESAALGMFLTLSEIADIRVAHNLTFDERIIRIALKRYGHDADAWKASHDRYCTMQNATKKYNMGKWPKLMNLHEMLIGTGFSGAHSAFDDASACLRCFLAMTKPEQP